MCFSADTSGILFCIFCPACLLLQLQPGPQPVYGLKVSRVKPAAAVYVFRVGLYVCGSSITGSFTSTRSAKRIWLEGSRVKPAAAVYVFRVRLHVCGSSITGSFLQLRAQCDHIGGQVHGKCQGHTTATQLPLSCHSTATQLPLVNAV